MYFNFSSKRVSDMDIMNHTLKDLQSAKNQYIFKNKNNNK